MKLLLVQRELRSSVHCAALVRAASGSVEVVGTGAEALEYANVYDYEAIVLSLELPDMSGYDVLRQLRKAKIATPILTRSSVTQPQAGIKAFELGADEFVNSACDPDELVARLHAVVRRSRGYCQPGVSLGPLTLDLSAGRATVHGKPVHLTEKELGMLELLVLRRGSAVTEDAFLRHLYCGRDEPSGKIIDIFICTLRKKLAQAGCADLISTVWGRGYMIREPGQVAARSLPKPRPKQVTPVAA